MDKHNKKWIGNNQGISLVEVIVVVLIIGIMTSVLIVNVSYAYSTNVSRSAEKLSDLIDLTRTQSMSLVEDSIELRVVRDSSGCYANTYKVSSGIELDSVELCSSSLSMSYDMGSGYVEIPIGGYITISFNKSSGSFKSSYKKIQITSASKTSTVILVKETGRNYIK